MAINILTQMENLTTRNSWKNNTFTFWEANILAPVVDQQTQLKLYKW